MNIGFDLKTPKEIKFEDICVGETFIFAHSVNKDLYLKIEPFLISNRGYINAVNLVTHKVAEFRDCTAVHILNHSMNVTYR